MIRFGRRLSRKTALTAAAGTLAVAGTLAGATPAMAAPDYDDPYVSGCVSGAYPVASAYIAVGKPNTSGNTGFGLLHLMYSPACKTNWAEFDSYAKGYRFLLVAWSHSSASVLTGEQEPWTSNGDHVAWTDMVNGTYPAGVGVCQDAPNGSVLNTGYLSQWASDRYICTPNQNDELFWTP